MYKTHAKFKNEDKREPNNKNLTANNYPYTDYTDICNTAIFDFNKVT